MEIKKILATIAKIGLIMLLLLIIDIIAWQLIVTLNPTMPTLNLIGWIVLIDGSFFYTWMWIAGIHAWIRQRRQKRQI